MKFLITTVFIFTVLFNGLFIQNALAQETTGTGVNTNQTTGAGNNTNQTTGTSRNTIKPLESVTLENPLDDSISSIPKFFQAIIDILLVFAIPFIVFFIIYAGFLYVTARGNTETISKAHKALLYALIGGVLILGANVLLSVITGTVTDITG